MYNDLGSAVRDADESSVNSLNFPEFLFRLAADRKQVSTMPKPNAKEDLLWIAEYERQGLNTAIKQLGEELGDSELMKALRIFIDVTDLYGQLYLLKDVGIRTR